MDNTPMQIQSVTLQGNVVRLEPLQLSHAQDLFQAAQETETWDYLPTNLGSSLEVLTDWIHQAHAEQAAGLSLPFAIIHLATGHAVGSTRYMAIDTRNYGLEIGWTWLAPEVRRTAVNTECKYLLLEHAFETFHAIRVQLKTDSRNLRSQQAIERIGALKEGTLRNHVITRTGYRRHSVYYSILDTEWPTVKARLLAKM